MQLAKYVSRRHCASLLALAAAVALVALPRPAQSQEIVMCQPTDQPRDDREIVLVPDDDDRDRGGALWWFGLGALPALFDLFHSADHHTSFQGSLGGGTGGNGSWGERFPPDGPGTNPGGPDGPGTIVTQDGPSAVPEPGALAFLAAPVVAGGLLIRARRHQPAAVPTQPS